MSLMTPVAPADTTDYAAVHRAIRSAGHALARAAGTMRPDDDDRMDALVRYWTGHAGEILAHHRVEDEIFFPALLERVPDRLVVLDQLAAEHHQLDVLMEETRRAIECLVTGDDPTRAAPALGRLAEVMDAHLDLEDREVVPAFVEHFSRAEYDELTKAAIASVGLGKQAAFTVPYVLYWANDEERATMLASAPLPMRILYRLTRKRHERLTELALGR